jgi:predicted lipoprotein with Yx(FWY)xxD motif
MPPQSSSYRARLRRSALVLAVAGTGFATAAVATLAAAKTFTLDVGANAKVTNTSGQTTHESILVNSRGAPLYTLTGDSKKHPECTKANGCFGFWVPVKVASAKKLTKAPGIKGTLSTWSRNGMTQAMLAGHPLYTFVNDKQRNAATGEGLKSFGGTWHVGKVATSSMTNQPGTTTSSSTPVMTTTTSSYTIPGY